MIDTIKKSILCFFVLTIVLVATHADHSNGKINQFQGFDLEDASLVGSLGLQLLPGDVSWRYSAILPMADAEEEAIRIVETQPDEIREWPRIQKAAIRFLGGIRSRQGVPALVSHIDYCPPQFGGVELAMITNRYPATESLIKIGWPSVLEILKRVGDGEIDGLPRQLAARVVVLVARDLELLPELERRRDAAREAGNRSVQQFLDEALALKLSEIETVSDLEPRQ